MKPRKSGRALKAPSRLIEGESDEGQKRKKKVVIPGNKDNLETNR